MSYGWAYTMAPVMSSFPFGLGVAHATLALWRKRGVQAEGEIGGGHRSFALSLGRPPISLKARRGAGAEGLAPKLCARDGRPKGQDATRGGSVHDSPARRVRLNRGDHFETRNPFGMLTL